MSSKSISNQTEYYVVYDGNCNLCVTFVQLLEKFAQNRIFTYIPMQEEETLLALNVTPEDCELGMMLINSNDLTIRWQGSDAGEKIVELLPNGQLFINAYRAIPNLKSLGDKIYIQVRDNRYQWFGRRQQTYYSEYNFCHNNFFCSSQSTETDHNESS